MAYIPYHTLMGYFYKPRPNVVNIIMKRIYKLHRVIFDIKFHYHAVSPLSFHGIDIVYYIFCDRIQFRIYYLKTLQSCPNRAHNNKRGNISNID